MRTINLINIYFCGIQSDKSGTLILYPYEMFHLFTISLLLRKRFVQNKFRFHFGNTTSGLIYIWFPFNHLFLICIFIMYSFYIHIFHFPIKIRFDEMSTLVINRQYMLGALASKRCKKTTVNGYRLLHDT